MKKFITVIELLLIIVVVCCGGYLGFYFYQSHTAQVAIAEIREQLPVVISDERVENGMLSDYYDLYCQNNEFSGWLIVPGTPIDYPVMQASDNSFYMHKDFNKEYKFCGLPFVDYQCNLYRNSTNTIIYAHNMKDGTMFAGLMDYKKKEFFEQNRKIIFNTLYDKGEYEILAVFYTTPQKFPYHSFINAESEMEFNDFIRQAKEMSLYETGVSANYGEYLLTLSTCSYNNRDERFVVIAKQISKN